MKKGAKKKGGSKAGRKAASTSSVTKSDDAIVETQPSQEVEEAAKVETPSAKEAENEEEAKVESPSAKEEEAKENAAKVESPPAKEAESKDEAKEEEQAKPDSSSQQEKDQNVESKGASSSQPQADEKKEESEKSLRRGKRRRSTTNETEKKVDTKTVPRAKRARATKPQGAEPEYFKEKRNLEDLWKDAFPVGTEVESSIPPSDKIGISSVEGKEPNNSMESSKNVVGAGLRNLGNSCYINSVLQCFTHTVPLLETLSRINACNCGNENFCVIRNFKSHIAAVLQSSRDSVSPKAFVENITQFSPDFKENREEDAHEFLNQFLVTLKGGCREGINIVDSVFGGGLVSENRCCSCKSVSNIPEKSVGLSLQVGDLDSLNSALDSFTCVETVEQANCDKCPGKITMEKRLLLDRLPAIATFHLKRFEKDGEDMKKISNHINFPVKLDLNPYMIDSQKKKNKAKYRLYALVEHIGTSLHTGHYCSYVRSSPNTWHKFNDEKVTSIDEASVLSLVDPYILFYAREDTRWFSECEKKLQMPSTSLSKKLRKPILSPEEAPVWKKLLKNSKSPESSSVVDKDSSLFLPDSETHLWWDLENGAKPYDLDGSDIYPTIKRRLRGEGFNGIIKMKAVVAYKDSLVPRGLHGDIEIIRAKKTNRPTTHSTKGNQVADECLVKLITDWLKGNPKPTNVGMISGDNGFRDIVTALRDAGHRVFCIADKGSKQNPKNFAPEIIEAATRIWYLREFFGLSEEHASSSVRKTERKIRLNNLRKTERQQIKEVQRLKEKRWRKEQKKKEQKAKRRREQGQ